MPSIFYCPSIYVITLTSDPNALFNKTCNRKEEAIFIYLDGTLRARALLVGVL